MVTIKIFVFAIHLSIVVSLECTPKINYNFVRVAEKRFSKTITTLDRSNCHQEYAYVQNMNSSPQEILTASKSYTFTQTEEVTIGNNSEMGVEVGAEIGFEAFIGSAKAHVNTHSVSTSTHKNTKSQSYSTTVAAPSQKINIKPNSKANITYIFCEVTRINEYLLDYEFNFSVTYPMGCISSPMNRMVLLSEFQRFRNLKNKGNPPRTISCRDYHGGGPCFMTNIPATEKIKGFEVEVWFGKDEPL